LPFIVASFKVTVPEMTDKQARKLFCSISELGKSYRGGRILRDLELNFEVTLRMHCDSGANSDNAHL